MRFPCPRSLTIPDADMKKIVLAAVVVIGCFFLQASTICSNVTLCFTGDILLDRGVRSKLAQFSADYPYKQVKSILKQADITFGNLECPLTNGGTPVLKRRDLIFKAHPANAYALRKAGYDLLNLANNHAMDQGTKGLEDTFKLISNQGLAVLGAGLGKEKAQSPVFFKAGNMTIGYLGYSDFPPEGYIYSDEAYTLSSYDEKTAGEQILRAKANCDFLIISMHFGKEFAHYPSENQKKVAHLAVDFGADLVIGHHPHVLQGMELYNGKHIFYSLGNFVFDKQIPSGTDESIILIMNLDIDGVRSIETIPVVILECQPRLATGKKKAAILKKFELYSKLSQ